MPALAELEVVSRLEGLAVVPALVELEVVHRFSGRAGRAVVLRSAGRAVKSRLEVKVILLSSEPATSRPETGRGVAAVATATASVISRRGVMRICTLRLKAQKGTRQATAAGLKASKGGEDGI